MFNLMYPVFYVGFICKSCVWEKDCEDSRQLKTKAIFTSSSQVSFPRSEACALHITRMRRVRTGWWQLVFLSVSRVMPSRKIPVKHSVLLNCHIWYTLYLPTLYIPPLPTDVEECFERKPYPQHLRVRDCYTHISLYNPLWFFLNSYLSIFISLRGW